MPAWSGFWNHVYSGGYTPIGSRNTLRGMGVALDGYGRRPWNRIVKQLVNGNVGGTASFSYGRVVAPTILSQVGLELGGKRALEQKSTINRATTAADITQLNRWLDFVLSPAPWPRDKSGNGGGGKRGY